MIEMDDNSKLRAFDKVASEYFDKNFGSFNKSDLEVLLFSEYIEYLIRSGYRYDDYSLSKELGITQSRVRTLKEKKELKYPIGKDYWKENLAYEFKYAKYDEEHKRIVIPIEDVNVLIEVRQFIKELGWYDEYQLNKKLLTLRIDCFADLCSSLSETNIFDKDTQRKLDKLKKADSSGTVEKFLLNFGKDGLKEIMLTASKDILVEVLRLLPFGGVAGRLIDGFCELL